MRISRRGFTLVEVLVASAVGALVLVGLYQALAGSVRGLEQGEAGLEANLRLQRLMEQLRQDFSAPAAWDPCTYPEEVLRQLGYGGGRISFALERRHVDRWVSFYVDGRGPTDATTRHEAGPKRVMNPLAPCRVDWGDCVSGAPVWLGPAPGKVCLDCLKAFAPRIEYVPFEAESEADLLVLGPAIWSWTPSTKKLVRWSQEDGYHDPGKGLVTEFEARPVEEWSANYLTKLPPCPGLSLDKSMLRVRLTLGRGDHRVELAVDTLLTQE